MHLALMSSENRAAQTLGEGAMRKAAVTRPELYVQYGEQLRLGLHLPPRHSDQLAALADTFFDPRGFWRADDRYAYECADQYGKCLHRTCARHRGRAGVRGQFLE